MHKAIKVLLMLALISQPVIGLAMEQKILDKPDYRTTNNNYACNYLDCGKTYVQFTDLRDHIESFHLNIIYICPLCGKKYSKKRTYNRHCIKVHHCFLCNICQKKFDEAKKVSRHRKEDHGGANQNNDDKDNDLSDQTFLARALKQPRSQSPLKELETLFGLPHSY